MADNIDFAAFANDLDALILDIDNTAGIVKNEFGIYQSKVSTDWAYALSLLYYSGDIIRVTIVFLDIYF